MQHRGADEGLQFVHRRTDSFQERSYNNCGAVSQIVHPSTLLRFIYEPQRKYTDVKNFQVEGTIRTGWRFFLKICEMS